MLIIHLRCKIVVTHLIQIKNSINNYRNISQKGRNLTSMEILQAQSKIMRHEHEKHENIFNTKNNFTFGTLDISQCLFIGRQG